MSVKKVCPICGKEFEQKVGNQIYCSLACARLANLQKANAAKKAKVGQEPKIEKFCPICRGKFYTTSEKQKYCSPHCHNQAVLIRESKPKETRAEREARQKRLIDEAEQCGLSYGHYVAQLRFFGKTFAELHAAH